ncbi:hypothetical protein [Streptomyces sp. SD15]
MDMPFPKRRDPDVSWAETRTRAWIAERDLDPIGLRKSFVLLKFGPSTT